MGARGAYAAIPQMKPLLVVAAFASILTSPVPPARVTDGDVDVQKSPRSHADVEYAEYERLYRKVRANLQNTAEWEWPSSGNCAQQDGRTR